MKTLVHLSDTKYARMIRGRLSIRRQPTHKTDVSLTKQETDKLARFLQGRRRD